MGHNTALIFGVTGQDGSYLAEALLSKGYDVHGFTRRTSVDNRSRLAGIADRIVLHEGNLADAGSIWRTLHAVNPREVYNLAAQTHVQTSFAEPEHTGDINALGPVRILEAIRAMKAPPKFYQASTSELFGQGGGPFNEESPMQPASPYGASKLYAFHMVRIYRQAYGLFACNGILFNHESPRRGGDFVTRKIARFARSLKDGAWDGRPLMLGNLDARRDWGHARDYAEGMWRMLQADAPGDYVLATGQGHSVRQFADAAMKLAGVAWQWNGDNATDGAGRVLIMSDRALMRPIDVQSLVGDAGKARRDLGWTPQSGFDDLVADMVDAA